MSTFAKSTFNASVYSASRPTYPSQLFDYIFEFHRRGAVNLNKVSWQRALDVGCGTGQATPHLRPFHSVLGIDPSSGMIEKAKSSFQGSDISVDNAKFSFVQGSCENMRDIVEDGSVDMIISAQAAHWFDWSKVWPETGRVLRQNGTAAFWIYAEFRLTKYPSLSPLITAFAQGTDPVHSLGSYFQRPGRTILERHLVDVPEPVRDTSLETLTRAYFCGDDKPTFLPPDGEAMPIIMGKEMRWRDLLAYFRTWSPLLTYHEKYPEDLKKDDDERFLEEDIRNSVGSSDDIRGGDIAIRFWKDLRQGALEVAPDVPVGAEDLVAVEWPIALLLTRKQ